MYKKDYLALKKSRELDIVRMVYHTFFSDGKIRHNYDQSIYKPDLEAWLRPGDISNSEKEKILKECPPEYKDKVTSILKQ